MDQRSSELKLLVKSAASLAAMAFVGIFGNMLSVVLFLKFYFRSRENGQGSTAYFDVA